MRPSLIGLVTAGILAAGFLGAEDEPPPFDAPEPTAPPKVLREEPDAPSATFEATQKMKSRAEKKAEKVRIEQIAANERILKMAREAVEGMKDASLTVYKIRESSEKPSQDSTEKFNGYDVLARCEADELLRKKWDAVALHLDTSGDRSFSCFEPGLALQWKDSAGKSVTAIVCLGCAKIFWAMNGQQHYFIIAKRDIFSIGEQYLMLFPDANYAEHLKKARESWEAANKTKATGR